MEFDIYRGSLRHYESDTENDTVIVPEGVKRMDLPPFFFYFYYSTKQLYRQYQNKENSGTFGAAAFICGEICDFKRNL